jgi:hypothetical protein
VVNATDLLNAHRARRTIRGTDFTVVGVRVGYDWKF